MNKGLCLWLLLLLFVLPATASAQRVNPAPNESHRELPGGPDLTNVEVMMAQRFQGVHILREWQDRANELLKDPQLSEKMRTDLREQLQKLSEKRVNGESINAQQVNDLLNRYAQLARQTVPHKDSESSKPGKAPENAALPPSAPPSDLPVPSSVPMPAEPDQSLLDRLQEQTTKWLIDNFEDVSGEMLQALTTMGANTGNTPLAELLRSVPQSDFAGINSRNHPLVPMLRSETLSRYFSNAGDFLHRQSGVWDKVGSLFHHTSVPSLPHVGGPSVSMRTPTEADTGGWLPAFLSLLMLGVIVLVICKMGFGVRTPEGPDNDSAWRPGPWPVRPSAVSTRQDVIRAFEYLALLRLGPAAAACHHHQLANLLIEQDDGNIGCRGAAEMLAWLYEQARYAPADADLSPEQLSDARHALCSLAGVTTA